MRSRPDTLKLGAVYLLENYTYVRVMRMSESHVWIRSRGSRWTWMQRRRMTVDALRDRLLAEVDGDFFPDLGGERVFCRPAQEAEALLRHLAEAAGRHPFGSSNPR